MESTVILLMVLVIAVIGKANSVAMAACILLFIKLANIDKYIFPVLESKGMFLGLVLLIATILIPIANGNVTHTNILHVFRSWTGIIALVLSLITTYLSGLGVQYLTVQGHTDVMPALIIGAVIAAAFLGGVPVGPFITSGILAAMIKIFSK